MKLMAQHLLETGITQDQILEMNFQSMSFPDMDVRGFDAPVGDFFSVTVYPWKSKNSLKERGSTLISTYRPDTNLTPQDYHVFGG